MRSHTGVIEFLKILIIYFIFLLQVTHMNFCEGLNQQRGCGIYSKYARILTRLTPVTFTFMSPVQKSNVLKVNSTFS